MAEIVIYYHLYNKKSGTFFVSPTPAMDSSMPNVMPIQAESPIAVAYTAEPTARTPGVISTFFLMLAKITALVGIAMILIFYSPKAVAWGKSVLGTANANFKISSSEVRILKSTVRISKPTYNPPFDATLPKENHLVISSIGVNTNVQEATLDNYESALRKGVWRVSDFGAPDDQTKPIILAAHRFGYLAWTDFFRRKNSFYRLPKVKVGDTVEIDWKQRKYAYGVYAVSKGTEITDYSADIILYTCETLTGPERIFVYAKLITT